MKKHKNTRKIKEKQQKTSKTYKKAIKNNNNQ